jgi:hypothetical protein
MQLNKASLSCNAIFSLIVLCLVIITFPSTDRLKYDDLDNMVLATNLPIIRHRDPLRIHVDKGHIPDLLEVGVATSTFNKHEARNFVDGHVLPSYKKATSDDAKKFFEAVASRHLTPLQVSMMLMGCYGYVYHDGHHSVTNVKSTFDLLNIKVSRPNAQNCPRQPVSGEPKKFPWSMETISMVSKMQKKCAWSEMYQNDGLPWIYPGELVQRAQAQAKSITKHQCIGMTGQQP